MNSVNWKELMRKTKLQKPIEHENGCCPVTGCLSGGR